MTEDLEIKNCFEFIFPEKWDNLERSDNENVRFCGLCEKQVFKATSKKSFDNFAKQNKCVAYFSEDKNTPGYMGETIHPVFNKDLKLD